MKTRAKWFIAFILVTIMLKLAYTSGVKDGERGLGYWEGWQDSMIATQFGTKPYNSETNLK